MKEPLLRKDEFSVVSDRANASIVWPDVMSPDELADFMEWLTVVKRKIERIASANYARNQAEREADAMREHGVNHHPLCRRVVTGGLEGCDCPQSEKDNG